MGGSSGGGFEAIGPFATNVVFVALIVILTLVFQKEHAQNCYVLALQKNAVRLFLLAPVYSVLILVTAYVVGLKRLWDIGIAFLDGYALYCFFALIILGAGGEHYVKMRFDSAAQLPVNTQQLQQPNDNNNDNNNNNNASGKGKDEGEDRDDDIISLGAGHVKFHIFLCIPLRFDNPHSLYVFLKWSVFQVMISRPICFALSALAESFGGRYAESLERLFRVIALLVLIYAVMIIGRVYHIIRHDMWKEFNPVMSFMIVKGFILMITIQDFLLSMIYSKVDPSYNNASTRLALRIYSLIVAAESIIYLFMARHYFHYQLFKTFNEYSTQKVEFPIRSFFRQVYSIFRVLDDAELPYSTREDNLGGIGQDKQDDGYSAIENDAAYTIEKGRPRIEISK